MKEMVKLGATLSVFALVACLALALVNGKTAPIISAAKEAEANAAMKVVFPQADSFAGDANFGFPKVPQIGFEKIVLAKKDGEAIGAVVQLSGPTYDSATLIVAVGIDGKIAGSSILALGDTPGFGQKAKDPGYMDQYVGKTRADGFVVKGDIDAVSGATITSRGIAAIMRAALDVSCEFLQAQGVLKEAE